MDELDLMKLCERWLRPCYECGFVNLYDDGVIDLADYPVLASQWGVVGDSVEDVTADGVVDGDDLRGLAGNWLAECSVR